MVLLTCLHDRAIDAIENTKEGVNCCLGIVSTGRVSGGVWGVEITCLGGVVKGSASALVAVIEICGFLNAGDEGGDEYSKSSNSISK